MKNRIGNLEHDVTEFGEKMFSTDLEGNKKINKKHYDKNAQT